MRRSRQGVVEPELLREVRRSRQGVVEPDYPLPHEASCEEAPTQVLQSPQFDISISSRFLCFITVKYNSTEPSTHPSKGEARWVVGRIRLGAVMVQCARCEKIGV